MPALQGLRPTKDSSDVDVLVEPDRHGELVAMLEEDGWVPRVAQTRAWYLPEHSVTMHHEVWACEIDLHTYYPGFLRSPAEVFDVLWSSRVVAQLAGLPVTTCDLAGNATILALHGLRNGAATGGDHGYDELVRRVRVGSRSLKSDIAALAESTGAVETLLPFLRAADIPVSTSSVPTHAAERAAWELHLAHDVTPSLTWLHELSRSPVRRWPGIVWRAFMLDPTEFDVDGSAGGRSSLWWARIRRLGRGVRGLPRGLRTLAQARAKENR